MFTFIPMFVFRFIGTTFILWLNSWVYLHVYKGKNILPSQVPTLGSRLRLQAHVVACFTSWLLGVGHKFYSHDHWPRPPGGLHIVEIFLWDFVSSNSSFDWIEFLSIKVFRASWWCDHLWNMNLFSHHLAHCTNVTM
jgi:hypothetical protein